MKEMRTLGRLITLLLTMPTLRCNKPLDRAHTMTTGMTNANAAGFLGDGVQIHVKASTTRPKARRDQTYRIDTALADNQTVCAANEVRQEHVRQRPVAKRQQNTSLSPLSPTTNPAHCIEYAEVRKPQFSGTSKVNKTKSYNPGIPLPHFARLRPSLRALESVQICLVVFKCTRCLT